MELITKTPSLFEAREKFRDTRLIPVIEDCDGVNFERWSRGFYDSILERVYEEVPKDRDELEDFMNIAAYDTISSQLIYTEDIINALNQGDILYRIESVLSENGFPDLTYLVQEAMSNSCTEYLHGVSDEMIQAKKEFWEV